MSVVEILIRLPFRFYSPAPQPHHNFTANNSSQLVGASCVIWKTETFHAVWKNTHFTTHFLSQRFFFTTKATIPFEALRSVVEVD